jgi:hypothetical protein
MVSNYVAYAGRNYENWYYVVMGLILPFKFFSKIVDRIAKHGKRVV